MTALGAAAFAALKAQADKGLHEDAAAAPARAREALLNAYRERFRTAQHLDPSGESAYHKTPWSEADLLALDWIHALARDGHCGAIQLCDRIFQSRERLAELFAMAPGMLRAMAPHAPRVASHLAREECKRAEPDLEAALRWLDAGRGSDPKVAEAMRELISAEGAVAAADWRTASDFLLRYGTDPQQMTLRKVSVPADLVWSFAKARLESSNTATHPAGERLLRRAADLGSARAADDAWLMDYSAATDKAAFLHGWFATYGKPTELVRLACLKLASTIELGDARAAPDFNAAVVWYERAAAKSSAHDTKPGELARDFCYWVAHAFDRRWRPCQIKNDALAMRWHERALAQGEDRCLDAWMTACVKGEMGLQADPDLALAQARRYCNSGVDLQPRKWMLATGIRSMAELAEKLRAEGDEARAAKWLAVAALLNA